MPRIKWPNDIFVHGKKVAGILSEMEAEGVQSPIRHPGGGGKRELAKEDIPPDLREIATSLRAEAGREFSRARVAAEFFEELEEEYRLIPQRRILAQAA